MAKENNIKFISYDGKYPNLCSGVLTIEINSERVIFGIPTNLPYEEMNKYLKSENYNPSFWMSGGRCWFSDNYATAHVDSAPWEFDIDKLNDKYKPYSDDIFEIFRNNVEMGCCGGCI